MCVLQYALPETHFDAMPLRLFDTSERIYSNVYRPLLIHVTDLSGYRYDNPSFTSSYIHVLFKTSLE